MILKDGQADDLLLLKFRLVQCCDEQNFRKVVTAVATIEGMIVVSPVY